MIMNWKKNFDVNEVINYEVILCRINLVGCCISYFLKNFVYKLIIEFKWK